MNSSVTWQCNMYPIFVRTHCTYFNCVPGMNLFLWQTFISGEEWDRARSLQRKMEDNLKSTMARMDELGRQKHNILQYA